MKIRILGLAIVFLAACQQIPESIRPVVAGLDGNEIGDAGSGKKKISNELLYKSVDGGKTWQNFTNGLPDGMDYGLIGVNGSEVFLSFENSLYRIDSKAPDGIWKQDPLVDEFISGIFPGSKGAYISSMGVGFYHEIPGTDVWVEKNSTLPDRSVRAVMELPQGGLIIVCDSGIYKSADGGWSWNKVFSGDFIFRMISAGKDLFAGAQNGVIHSGDNGEHWEYVIKNGGAAFHISPVNGGIAAVFNIKGDGPWRSVNMDGSHNQLMYSTNAGQTWQDLGQNLPHDSNIRNVVQWGASLYCSMESGLYRSNDQGASWELILPAKGGRYYEVVVSGSSLIAVLTSAGC